MTHKINKPNYFIEVCTSENGVILAGDSAGRGEIFKNHFKNFKPQQVLTELQVGQEIELNPYKNDSTEEHCKGKFKIINIKITYHELSDLPSLMIIIYLQKV